MDKLKRFNNFNFLMVLVAIIILAAGCHRKNRLTNSTFDVVVTPPAKMVLNGGSITLSAAAHSLAGRLNGVPTWSVSPSNVGAVVPEIGNTVVFTGAELGDAVVTATIEGVSGTSQIAVVTYIPDSADGNVFDIYSDAGIPTGASFPTSTGLDISEVSTGYTPEGIYYQHTLDANDTPLDFWGITIPSANKNSFAAAGELRFSIRLDRALNTSAPVEFLRIKVEHQGGSATVLSSAWNNFSPDVEDEWQDVTIPLSSFVGVDFTQITTPFLIEVFNVASPLTFDVDAIRWQK